jgi:hypothetical protein
MSGPIKFHNFKGQLMTASQIARSHGLSLPTIMRRLARGMTDDDLVAAQYVHPRVAGQARVNSDRTITAGEAARWLKRAEASLDRASLHYRNSILACDPPKVQARLKLAVDKAMMMVSYWRECLRVAEARKAKPKPEINGRWRPKPEKPIEVSSANPDELELGELFCGED